MIFGVIFIVVLVGFIVGANTAIRTGAEFKGCLAVLIFGSMVLSGLVLAINSL